jgi:hypothetical protein
MSEFWDAYLKSLGKENTRIVVPEGTPDAKKLEPEVSSGLISPVTGTKTCGRCEIPLDKGCRGWCQDCLDKVYESMPVGLDLDGYRRYCINKLIDELPYGDKK